MGALNTFFFSTQKNFDIAKNNIRDFMKCSAWYAEILLQSCNNSEANGKAEASLRNTYLKTGSIYLDWVFG